MGTPRKPSGIPSAAVAHNRGASVSSGFPSRQSLGGLHDATARSVTFVQAPPAKSALTPFPGPELPPPCREEPFSEKMQPRSLEWSTLLETSVIS